MQLTIVGLRSKLSKNVTPIRGLGIRCPFPLGSTFFGSDCILWLWIQVVDKKHIETSKPKGEKPCKPSISNAVYVVYVLSAFCNKYDGYALFMEICGLWEKIVV